MLLSLIVEIEVFATVFLRSVPLGFALGMPIQA